MRRIGLIGMLAFIGACSSNSGGTTPITEVDANTTDNSSSSSSSGSSSGSNVASSSGSSSGSSTGSSSGSSSSGVLSSSSSGSSGGNNSSSSGSGSSSSSSSGGSDASAIVCSQGYSVCGTSCIQDGNTCCASVGLPQLSCSNGGTCNSDGICTGSCSNASALFICGTGETPYSCTGPMVPTATNSGVYISGLTCSAGTVGVGSTVYCCIQECAAPTGTYQTVYTITSGNCGNIASTSGVYSGSNNLLYLAENAGVCFGTGLSISQDGSSVSANVCSGSISETCIGTNPNNNDQLSSYSVVSITSNQAGNQLTGTTTLTVTDTTIDQAECSGTYSFVATQTSP